MIVNGAPEAPEVKTLPRHKKNPDVGTKKTVFSKTILIEQEDAKSFTENEEVTLIVAALCSLCLVFYRLR